MMDEVKCGHNVQAENRESGGPDDPNAPAGLSRQEHADRRQIRRDGEPGCPDYVNHADSGKENRGGWTKNRVAESP
jgi:hypothetical protein